MTVGDELTKLNQLRKEGVLSEEEFQTQKERLLAGKAGTSPKVQVSSPSSSAQEKAKSNLPLILGLSIGIPLLVLTIVLGVVLSGPSTDSEGSIEGPTLGNARIEAARMKARMISQAAAQYARMIPEKPTLHRLVESKYIKPSDTIDPWNNPFRLRPWTSANQPFQVCSSGPNGVPGGDDDICDPQ